MGRIRPKAIFAGVHARNELAGGGHGVEGRDRRRVVNDPPPRFLESEQLPEPVEDQFLQFGGGRRRPPEHPVDIEGCAQEFTQDAGTRAGDGEIGEESRVIPVRQPRDDDLPNITQNGLHLLALFRGTLGQVRTNLARLRARQYRIPVQMGQVIGDPVHEFMTVPSEFRRIHVSERSVLAHDSDPGRLLTTLRDSHIQASS